MSFDQSTRNRLARFVGDARAKLTEEFTRQLQQEYGLDPARGEVTDLARLSHLDDSRRATALLLRETLDYYLASQPRPDAKARRETLERIVREQAFTILNRLCALRMAESRGLLIESVGLGYRSKGFQLYSRLAGTGLGETGDAYRWYLFSLFDELAVDLPALFDRYAPEGRLFPRETALLEVLALINAPDIAPLWTEDETIGWIYQYFNSAEERRQMRAESQAPRNSRELAVRNQFFTPRYVVEFLTDNTLGRIWYEMTQGNTGLKESCRYLVRRPTEIFLAEGEEAPQQDQPAEDLTQEELLRQPVYIPYRPLKDPRDIRMLDPACGSMHFGLYAFDLFERIYEEAWEMQEIGQWSVAGDQTDHRPLTTDYASKEAFLHDVPHLIIEHNIHGIDIDPRAVQIAGLSLWMRAQRSWQAQGLRPQARPHIQRSHIVCAEPMPGNQVLLDEFLAGLRTDRLEGLIRRVLDVPATQQVRATERMAGALCDLVRVVWQEMKLAGEAGSLLKIEETLANAVRAAEREWSERMPLFRVVEFSLSGEAERIRYPRSLAGEDGADFWQQAEALVLAALQDYAEQAQNGAGYQRRLFAADAARGFALVDVCRKRYDVVLMNPPFGEAAQKSKAYIGAQFSNSTADIFQVFVERGLDWLSQQGREGVISARTGFFLGSGKDWRENVIFRQRLACFADLGLGVLDDALVEVAVYVIECGNPFDNMILTNRQLDTREKADPLLLACEATGRGETNSFEIFDQSLVQVIPDQTFAYWAPASFIRRYESVSGFGSVIGRVRQGVATADDFRFARLGWEVGNASIGISNRWKRFSKGGEYSPPYDDIHLLVDWGEDGRQLKAFPNCFIRNEAYYLLPGATYTVRTASAFAGKVLPRGCVFSHNAQSWFADSPDITLFSIGFLSCRVPQAFLELAVGGGDIATAGSAARRYTTAVVESVPSSPISAINTHANRSSILAIYRFRLTELMADETSCHFAQFHATRDSSGLRDAVDAMNHQHLLNAITALDESAKFDHAVCQAFRITAEESRFVDEEIGVHTTAYTGYADKAEVFRLFHLPENSLMAEAVATHGSKRWFTKKSYFVDRRLEIICHHLGIAPSAVAGYLNQAKLSLDLEDKVQKALSEVIGCVLGRWDIRFATGERLLPPFPDPFDPLPTCSPGMLQNAHGLSAAPADVPADYPLRISWPGILVDDPGHLEDIEVRVRDALRVIWPGAEVSSEQWAANIKQRVEGAGFELSTDHWPLTTTATADAIEQEACQILGVGSLREYFASPSRFFGDHLKRYSKSRRQAPIYWPLSTRSGSYTLWLYYHRLSDQILYTCVNDFVDPKLKQVSDEASRLRQKRDRSSADEEELEQLATLELELKDLRAELLRIAAFWRPNLNDGVQITAAPLWRLIQHRLWQKTIKETWEKLEAGEYDWAHLAMCIWPERVVPKCGTDRSLAIAHDVEDLFWVEDPEGKWRNLRSPDEELANLVDRQRSPARERLRDLFGELGRGRARGLRCAEVVEELSAGRWDDLEVALLLWPQRVAERCWDDPLLAVTLQINLPTKRTKAGRERWVKERVATGCPDLAEALIEALAGRPDRFSVFWSELARGDRDDLSLALALWPARVVARCAEDPDLAAWHGVRRFLWVQDSNGLWRWRKALEQEITTKMARRNQGH